MLICDGKFILMVYFCETCKDASSLINSSLRCCPSIMSHPVAERSKSNGTDWKKLRIICSQSISRFTSGGATSGNDSDESKIVPGLTASSTDSESPCIVSPSGSSFSFEDLGPLVACDNPHYEGDLRSPLTQTFLKPYMLTSKNTMMNLKILRLTFHAPMISPTAVADSAMSGNAN